jgi:transcriptional regulator with XRE-family HTH domain
MGFTEATKDYLPIQLVERLIAGEHPIRVWRAYRGVTREALAEKAGVAPSYLTEIETRKKPGSFEAMIKLATALGISLDDIAAWVKPRR